MPIRVELMAEAFEDPQRYATSGTLPLFLKTLLRLEDVGRDAGVPLGRGLTGWRKIVVGDRNWRVIFAIDADETTATVWVIGDRLDTDIRVGRRLGLRTVLPLTGVTSRVALEAAAEDERPDFVIESLEELPDVLERRGS